MTGPRMEIEVSPLEGQTDYEIVVRIEDGEDLEDAGFVLVHAEPGRIHSVLFDVAARFAKILLDRAPKL